MIAGHLRSSVQPSNTDTEEKSKRVPEHIHMGGSGTQQGQQADSCDQRRPSIPAALAQREALSPRQSCEQAQRREHGSGRSHGAMSGRRNENFRIVAERSRSQNARPRDAGAQKASGGKAREHAEQQIAEQVFLVQMQGQRRHGPPPFASGAGVESAQRQPVGAE